MESPAATEDESSLDEEYLPSYGGGTTSEDEDRARGRRSMSEKRPREEYEVVGRRHPLAWGQLVSSSSSSLSVSSADTEISEEEVKQLRREQAQLDEAAAREQYRLFLASLVNGELAHELMADRSVEFVPADEDEGDRDAADDEYEYRTDKGVNVSVHEVFDLMRACQDANLTATFPLSSSMASSAMPTSPVASSARSSGRRVPQNQELFRRTPEVSASSSSSASPLDSAAFDVASLTTLKSQVRELIEICFQIMTLTHEYPAEQGPSMVQNCWAILQDLEGRRTGAKLPPGSVGKAGFRAYVAATSNVSHLPSHWDRLSALFSSLVPMPKRGSAHAGEADGTRMVETDEAVAVAVEVDTVAKVKNKTVPDDESDDENSNIHLIRRKEPSSSASTLSSSTWVSTFLLSGSLLEHSEIFRVALRDSAQQAGPLAALEFGSVEAADRDPIACQLAILRRAGAQTLADELEAIHRSLPPSARSKQRRLIFTRHEDTLILVGMLRFGRSPIAEVQRELLPHKHVSQINSRIKNHSKLTGSPFHTFWRLRRDRLVDFEVDWLTQALRAAEHRPLSWESLVARVLPYRSHTTVAARWIEQFGPAYAHWFLPSLADDDMVSSSEWANPPARAKDSSSAEYTATKRSMLDSRPNSIAALLADTASVYPRAERFVESELLRPHNDRFDSLVQDGLSVHAVLEASPQAVRRYKSIIHDGCPELCVRANSSRSKPFLSLGL